MRGMHEYIAAPKGVAKMLLALWHALRGPACVSSPTRPGLHLTADERYLPDGWRLQESLRVN